MPTKHCLHLVLAMVTACLGLAACTTTDGSASKPWYAIDLPFSFVTGDNSHMPIISITSDQGQTLRLAVDSGCPAPIIYDSGVAKLLGKAEALADLAFADFQANHERYTGQPAGNKSTAELRAEFELLIGNGYLTLNVTGLKAGQRELPKLTFLFNAKFHDGYAKTNIDGIIGLDAFGPCRNIIIDYRQQLIALDDDPITESAVAMAKNPITALYEIDYTINGQPDRGIIDTGSAVIVLRKDYGQGPLSLDSDQVSEFIMNGNLAGTPPQWIPLSAAIGGIRYPLLFAVRASDRSLKTIPQAARVAQLYGLLGYPYFRGHRIQFDFENSLFRID